MLIEIALAIMLHGLPNLPPPITFETTSYTNHPSENGGWTTTALGTPTVPGVVAVDPKVMPLGSLVYVQGWGLCRAEDTGGAIKGNRIDIVMSSKADCFSWGRKDKKVWIIN